MTTQNLLVELLVEELPPKSLKKLGEAFAEVLVAKLKLQGLVANDAVVTAYATPRRLAVHVTNVADQAADKQVSQKLMPVTIGLDANGQPTSALLKKLFGLGVNASAVPNLTRKNDGKVDVLFIDTVVKGMDLTSLLGFALGDTLGNLPIAKEMSYQLADGWSSVNFVRPAHSLIALHGADIVPISVLGLTAGRETQGHRFEAASATLAIRNADSYETQLGNEGAVIASFAKRRAEIARQLAAAAAQENLQVIQDEALLDEVTGLVERPNVLLGQFEKEFLDVPPECLILTMKANQKYFPLLDNAGKLTNKFLIVSNITPADPSAVIQGNERVVRPRLADAKFFFDKDRKHTLASRGAGLDKVVYHNKLGTQGERVQRVRAIAIAIAQQLGGNALAAQAEQAAMLAKADLLTDMVGEFPELQGIMGRYYAQAEGIDDEVAYAIEDHYKPRFAGDELPRNRVGVCVALADKLETLVGMFSIGQAPTGDKDPFALRRHALGVIRMLVESELLLSIGTLLEITYRGFVNIWPTTFTITYSDGRVETKVAESMGAETQKYPIRLFPEPYEAVTNFVYERLSSLLREKAYSAQEVDAVISLCPQRLSDIPKRLAAVRAFATLPEAASLAAANKRVGNILKKSEVKINGTVDLSLLKEPAEILLHQTLSAISPKADAAFEQQDYTASLQLLAALKSPVDDFFDNVMVNVDDVNLRNNRLALLSQLQQAMNRVADISKLAA